MSLSFLHVFTGVEWVLLLFVKLFEADLHRFFLFLVFPSISDGNVPVDGRASLPHSLGAPQSSAAQSKSKF